MSRSFWYGFSVAAAVICFYQDWLGQHAYLDAVREHWVPIPWWVWPPVIAVMMLGEIGHTMMERERGRDGRGV